MYCSLSKSPMTRETTMEPDNWLTHHLLDLPRDLSTFLQMLQPELLKSISAVNAPLEPKLRMTGVTFAPLVEARELPTAPELETLSAEEMNSGLGPTAGVSPVELPLDALPDSLHNGPVLKLWLLIWLMNQPMQSLLRTGLMHPTEPLEDLPEKLPDLLLISNSMNVMPLGLLLVPI